jgi:hypothetical protein
MSLIVNFFGGPGTGKSTTCAAVFAELKTRGVSCEMALEYAKDLVWNQNWRSLENQLHVFGEQHERIYRLEGEVDCILTDSPLLNSFIYYEDTNAHFLPMVRHEHFARTNLNFMLNRVKEYNPKGRTQNEEKARELDTAIRSVLDRLEVFYLTSYDGGTTHAKDIADVVQANL